jgi:hypothetical protein
VARGVYTAVGLATGVIGENMHKLLTALWVVGVLTGCASHKSPLQEAEGNQFIFVTDDETEIFKIAHSTIAELAPSFPITDFDGPIRGYSVTRISLIDRYTSVVRIFPATGKTLSGQTVFGYYPEVSGNGTLFDGPSFNEKLYAKILAALEQTATRTNVASLNRSKYKFDSDRWRLTDSPSLRDGGTINVITKDSKSTNFQDVRSRLMKIEELRKEKIITAAEFERLRKRILDDL